MSGGIVVFYKNKYILAILLVLTMMVGGYALGIYIGQHRLEENLKNNNEDQGFETMQATKQDDREIVGKGFSVADIINENTLLIFETNYTACNDKRVEERKANEDEIGLNRQELESNFPEWDVYEFSSSKVILTKELDDYCPNHFILKDKDGMIVIYMPSKGENESRSIQNTQIPINKLPPDFQDEIRKGLVIDSLQEIEYFLESLES